jgi:hypothetical protein
MVIDMRFRKIPLILTLCALPLVVGSECAFFFSSGGGSGGGSIDREEEEDEDDEVIVVADSGSFGSPPVEGVSYESGSLSGVTDSTGAFQYETGKTVRFFIGDVGLGVPVPGKPIVKPQDLVAQTAPNSPAAVNISRLLLSLDSNADDEVITIPEAVRTAAVRTNEDVTAAIEFLDFSNESAFVNSASQLVAVLTQDYAHTATLVDAGNVQERMIERP